MSRTHGATLPVIPIHTLSRTWWISLVLCFMAGVFSSCSLVSHKHFERQGTVTLDTTRLPLYFEDGFEKAMFKTRLKYKENYFSGIMLLKKVNPSHHRATLITEMGLKLMDMELEGEVFTLHYCVEALNKKLLVRTLENDLKLLLMGDALGQEAMHWSDRCESRDLYRTKSGGAVYYFVDAPVLTRIETASLFPGKLIITFEKLRNGFPWRIKMDHRPVNLIIEWDRIK